MVKPGKDRERRAVLVAGESSFRSEQCPFPRILGKYRFLLAATQSLPVAKTLAFRDPRLHVETTNEYIKPPAVPKIFRPKSLLMS